MMKNRSQESRKYRSLSRRLSLRIILVVLTTMVLMGWAMVELNKVAMEEMNDAHYHVLLDVTDQLIEKDLENMKRVLANDSTGETRRKSLRWLRQWLMEQDKNFNKRGMAMISDEVTYEKEIWVYSVVIGRDGHYISHPDSIRMLNDNFLDQVRLNNDTLSLRLADDIQRGVGGEAQTVIDSTRVQVFYDPLNHTDWMMAIIVPQKVKKILVLTWSAFQAFYIIIALLVIYLVCHFTIRRTTRPLNALSKSAGEVAKGRFDVPLPEIRHHDEVAQLRDSFDDMQQSLGRYMERLQATTSEKASIEQELKIANGIQMALLPKTFPERDDISLHAYINPARDVGGDLYDFFLSENRLVFCIGDVSGKGVPAALLMAVTRAMFRSEARRSNSATAIVKTMNHNLSYEYTANYFVTMFVGILDLRTGHLDYCNAGHEPPLVNGRPLDVRRNLPVGALPEWDYEGQETALQGGDMLFLFTDGLSEAQNADGKLFGRQRIRELVCNHADSTPQQLAEVVEDEVHRFVGDTEQSDDLTLLIIKWQQSEPVNNHLSMRADMADISQMDPFIAEVSRQAGLTDRESRQMRLALEEAVANVINYGQATFVNLDASIGDGFLKVTVTDDGIPFDATSGSPTDLSLPPDRRPPGGLGIMLLHRMTDVLGYERTDDRNVLTLVKRTGSQA